MFVIWADLWLSFLFLPSFSIDFFSFTSNFKILRKLEQNSCFVFNQDRFLKLVIDFSVIPQYIKLERSWFYFSCKEKQTTPGLFLLLQTHPFQSALRSEMSFTRISWLCEESPVINRLSFSELLLSSISLRILFVQLVK